MGKLEIYIADDDEDDRMFIREAIAKVVPSALIIEALDGMDLIEKLQDCTLESQFIMILVDMNMPRLNGLETVSRIKSDPKFQKIPTIMMSTSQTSELKLQAYDLGVDRFLTKPFTFDEYEEIVLDLKMIYVDQFLNSNKKA